MQWRASHIEDLPEIAKQLLDFSKGRRVWAFYGDMGAGKTTFIRALCENFHVLDSVQSPTFAIANEYRSEQNESVFHFDFYRINRLEEAFDIGCLEYFESGSYCFVEWPEKVEELLPPDVLKIYISTSENKDRIFRLEEHPIYQIQFPKKEIEAKIEIPSSKSISNRLLILRHLCLPNLQIANLSYSGDTKKLESLCKALKIKSTSFFDCGNAGAVLRFLTPILAVSEGAFEIGGSVRMSQRPIGPLVETLRKMGADITYKEKDAYPPLQIKGKSLSCQEIEIDASLSSQFVSALLLLTVKMPRPVRIRLIGSEVVSRPYIQMTLELLRYAGLNARMNSMTTGVEISGEIEEKGVYFVESDWTSASYFYMLCAFSHKTRFFLPHYFAKSLQGDAVLADIFVQFGVQTIFEKEGIYLEKISSKYPTSFYFDCTDYPDLAQSLAVLCAGLGVSAHLTGLQSLQHKETDRLEALYIELSKCGVMCEKKGREELHILSSVQTTDFVIETYEDHRMAMAFAPLAILFPGIKISNPKIVEKSFPSYWDCLKKSGAEITESNI